MSDIYSNVFSEPVNVLMTINGSLSTPINLEMLCATISHRTCTKVGITKFIGFNKIYFYDPQFTYHSDDNKYFFNQCSFEFKNKIIIKLFSNGTYIITGCTTETDARHYLASLLDVLIYKKYVYLPRKLATTETPQQTINMLPPKPYSHPKRLALVYNVQSCSLKTLKIALSNYSISLNKFEFNKYKVLDIVNTMDQHDKNIIESITDIFKYSSVSIKLRNVSGNIDIYKNKVIISVQNKEHYPILLQFFDKHKYNLISLPTTNTMSKLVFLNAALALSGKRKHDQHLSKKIINITNNILDTIQQ